MSSLSKLTLELTPARRLDVIDVNRRVEEEAGDFLARHRKTLYCSYHTTAGYLEQSLCQRLGRQPGQVRGFLEPYQRLFPPGADYHHDRLERRTELSDEQRQTEPRNADSHLTFIGSGLESCVTYDNSPGAPVYFIDLDGVNANGPGGRERRRRRTTLIGFDRATEVAQAELKVPVSGHPIDSVNLKDPSLGFYDQIEDLIARYGIEKGRLDLMLADGEEHASLTVNEDETLLMTHDLREVLDNPMHFMAAKGWSLLSDPRSIRAKAKRYAKYDLVQIINKVLDKTGLDGSLAERFIDKFLASAAEHRLRMKRSMSLFISDDFSASGALPGGTSNHASNGHAGNGQQRGSHGRIVQGRFQSPILVQWRPSETPARRIVARLSRFE